MDTERSDGPVGLSIEEVAAKVAWEGGVFETLRCGLRADQVSDHALAAMWKQMETLYEQIAPIAWRIESSLGQTA